MAEEARRSFDFDAFREEHRSEADRPVLTAKVAGVDHPLRPDLPVLMVMDVERAKRADGKATLTAKQALEYLRQLFVDPDTALATVGAREAPYLLVGIIELYQEAAAPPPNRRVRRVRKSPRTRSTSSSGGRSSRRTSSANTGSISAAR